MNIFVLDENPKIAAKYHCTKHRSKMLLEAAQLLVTPYYTLRQPNAKKDSKLIREELTNEHSDFPRDNFFGIGYYAHPCAKWVQYSKKNWDWLMSLALELGDIFVADRGKSHATTNVLNWMFNHPPKYNNVGSQDFYTNELTIPANATYVKDLPINSWSDIIYVYKLYYIRYKSYMATWPEGQIPKWYSDMLAAEPISNIDFSKVKNTTKLPQLIKDKTLCQQ